MDKQQKTPKEVLCEQLMFCPETLNEGGFITVAQAISCMVMYGIELCNQQNKPQDNVPKVEKTYEQCCVDVNNKYRDVTWIQSPSHIRKFKEASELYASQFKDRVAGLEVKNKELESIIEFGDGMILQLKNEIINLNVENKRLGNEIIRLKIDMVEIKHVALDLEYAKSIAEQALNPKSDG